MFCTACATANPPAAERCAVCGARLARSGPRGLRSVSAAVPRSSSWLRGKVGRALTLVPLLLILAVGGTVGARYRSERSGLAAAYDGAERALAADDYETAIADFARAGSYRDAAGRRVAVQAELAPYRNAYYDGVAALDAGRYDDAIAALLPVARDLPTYHDVLALLEDARRRRASDLDHDAEVAIARHDWLTADHALSQLLAEDPGNAGLAGRLAALRRDHAPIVFTRDAALYVVGPDLADERLITDAVPAEAPAWSPDRTQIAFFSPNPGTVDSSKLYVIGADGTGLRKLADLARMDWWPVWSPDGTRIAFTSAASFTVNGERGYASTHVVDLATGVETDLTGDRFISATSATWSPTGDRVAFVSRRVYNSVGFGNDRSSDEEVFVANLVTGGVTSVSHDRLRGAERVTWSPAADELLVLTREGDAAYGEPHTAIHLIDLPTGEIERLTPPSQTVGPPYWSPDGTRFAYVEGGTDQGNAVVRVRLLTGRGEAGIGVAHPLTQMLTWAPDGTALIALALDPVQGSALIPLADGPGSQVDLPIVYDIAANLGPLQWSAFNPARPPIPPSYDGTALDR
jgi:Tol biopolymer transport system component